MSNRNDGIERIRVFGQRLMERYGSNMTRASDTEPTLGEILSFGAASPLLLHQF